MDIDIYDKIVLRDGRKAVIVEIYEPGKAYEADIEQDGDYVTDTVKQEDILAVLK